MTIISPSIFKKYDIRGKALGADAPLTPDTAYAIGRGVGTYSQRILGTNHVVSGRDNRKTSYELQQALINGLRRSGCHVTDIGLVSTPLVYWHTVRRHPAVGVMVTGSHLTAAYNGFKLCYGRASIHSEEIQAIANIIASGNFAVGNGDLVTDETAYSAYIHDVALRAPMSRPLKVVVDPGNGTGGIFAMRLMQLWGHEAVGIYIEPDGDFPNHLPNPQDADTLRDLCARVVEWGADIGLAFDGDADRVGAVDERGQVIAADRLLALLARDMLNRHPGAGVVGEVLCSQVLFDVVRESGGVPFLAPSGHALVKEKLHDTQSLIGGEMSGHIFLAEDYLGFDDGYMVAGRLLSLLSASEQTLSQLDDSLPRLYSTAEYRPHCPDEHKATVIRAVAEALDGQGEVIAIDGVRITFERGWGIVRASNTEPVLSLRFEGQTEADARDYQERFFAVLRQFPFVTF